MQNVGFIQAGSLYDLQRMVEEELKKLGDKIISVQYSSDNGAYSVMLHYWETVKEN